MAKFRMRRRRRRGLTQGIVALPIVVVAVWWFYPLGELEKAPDPTQNSQNLPLLITDRPEDTQGSPSRPNIAEKGETKPENLLIPDGCYDDRIRMI